MKSLLQRETGGIPSASLPGELQNACVSCFASRAKFQVFAAFPGCVTALALEPTRGRVLLATDTRAVVRLFDGEARLPVEQGGAVCGAPLASYFNTETHSRAVTTCAWYPRDGGLFVTGGADGAAVAWDPGLAGGGKLSPVCRVVLGGGSGSSASGSSAAAGAAGGGGRVHCVAMSPVASTHALVACGTEAPSVRLLDLASGVAVQALPGHRDGVVACAWSPLHEHLLASGSRDGALLLHDVRRSGSLALLAAADAHATERQWLDTLAPGAAGRLAGLKLPGPSRESLGLAYRGGREGTDTAVLGNPTGDVATTTAKAHGPGGVNGLHWASAGVACSSGASGGGGGGGAGRRRCDDGHLVSTGADGVARLWKVALVREGEEDDTGNLVDGVASGAAVWNSLRDFKGIKNKAKRCIRLAMSSSCSIGSCSGSGSGSAAGRGAATRGDRGGRSRRSRASPRGDLLFHPFTGAKAGAAAEGEAGDQASSRGAIGAWDLASGACCGVLSGGHMETVNAVEWGGYAGGTLFSGGDDGLILRWSVPSWVEAVLEVETEEEDMS
jgi:DNA excision repair protein ERCC-8